MSVRTQYDEETNVYNLVDDIDGVPIVFASVPGDSVQGRITSVNEANAGGGNATTTATGGGGGGGGGSFNAADFTDNGDGTFTRTSDGTQGRFTPSGFEPTTAT